MIRFFLEYENTVAQLPVNPSELSIKIQGNNKTSEVIGIGEINILRGKKLAEIEIESFFPEDDSAPYVLTKGKFEPPQFYIDLIDRARTSTKPLRLVVSDTGIRLLVSVENFEHTLKAQDNDVYYTLSLKEFKSFGARVPKLVKPENKTKGSGVTSGGGDTRPKKGFAVGDTVIASGKYWASSYGDGPSGTFTNFTGKISHIVADTKRKYRYHITTPTGGYRGWVSSNQLKIK